MSYLLELNEREKYVLYNLELYDEADSLPIDVRTEKMAFALLLEGCTYWLKDFPKEIMEKEDFIKEALKINPEILTFLSEKYLGDKKFIKERVFEDNNAYNYASDVLKKDFDFFLELLKDNGNLLNVSSAKYHIKEENVKKILKLSLYYMTDMATVFSNDELTNVAPIYFKMGGDNYHIFRRCNLKKSLIKKFIERNPIFWNSLPPEDKYSCKSIAFALSQKKLKGNKGLHEGLGYVLDRGVELEKIFKELTSSEYIDKKTFSLFQKDEKFSKLLKKYGVEAESVKENFGELTRSLFLKDTLEKEKKVTSKIQLKKI